MNITLMAHDKKKELMVQFCTAYKSILAKHNRSATATTGRLVAEATGLPVTLFLSHSQGGHQQVNARIAYNEIDMVLLFSDPNGMDPWEDQQIVKGTLTDIAQKVKEAGIRKTALVTVGRFLGDTFELSRLYDAHFTTEFRKGV